MIAIAIRQPVLMASRRMNNFLQTQYIRRRIVNIGDEMFL
jgi:hypothetical protein